MMTKTETKTCRNAHTKIGQFLTGPSGTLGERTPKNVESGPLVKSVAKLSCVADRRTASVVLAQATLRETVCPHKHPSQSSGVNE